MNNPSSDTNYGVSDLVIRRSKAELPTEDRHRRPVPSTSFPCRAWFYRLRSPFFRRREAAVQERLFPLQQALPIEGAQQRSPGVEPHILLFPLLQPPPASRRRRILVGQESPRRSGLQHPQNTLQASPIGRPRTTSLVLAPLRLRQQRLDQLPLCLTQQLE